MAQALAQLVDDYLDEEQCTCSELMRDDAALELIDTVYTEFNPPNS